MTKHLSARERDARIEILRARAAIERQSVAHGLQNLGQSLTPRGLMQSFFPRASRRSPSDLALQALTFSKRYPMVMSLGSALLTTAGRRRLRWWKVAAGLVVAWQMSRNLRS